jgi:hypothetical protein
MALLVLGEKPFPLPDGSELVLGRHRECGVQILDEKSSRRHARVFHRDGEWWVEDLGSANGTRLNGRALTAATRLDDADVIGIGAMKLCFRLGDDAEGTILKPPAPAPVDDAELVGRVFGGNRLDRYVGRGLTGPVFRAWCEARKREVMIRVLDSRLTADPEFAPRFQRALAAATAIGHPSAVRLLESASSEGRLWYGIQLGEGETLAQRLQEPLAPRAAMDIVLGIGGALAAYHEARLVHGDVNPSAIGFDDQGRPRLVDIGLVGLTTAEGRMLQVEGGARQVFYLCPVQARGGQWDARSDIYGLGCILFHLLAGRPPFVGESVEEVVGAHEHQPVPRLAASAGLPAKLDEVLAGMLHKDPFSRSGALGPVLRELGEVRARMTAA